MFALFLISIACGLIVFRLMLILLPIVERKSNFSQKQEVLTEAQLQSQTLRTDAANQLNERIQAMGEELDTFLVLKNEDLKLEEKDLMQRESFLEQEQQRLDHKAQLIQEQQTTIAQLDISRQSKDQEIETTRKSLIYSLEKAAETEAQTLKKDLSAAVVNEKQLELQRLMKFVQEDLSSSAPKAARRILDRVHARYAPEFVWPKATNIVEVKERRFHNALLMENNALIEELQTISGAKIIPFQPTNDSLFIKVVGGFGISREAARLTLEKLLVQEMAHWNKAASIFANQSARLETEAFRLGQKATEILKLKNIQPELQRLVGALNWRTSYRQNQWYHTVEVAQFAGILAYELGINIEDAKRVGLLHDIGKAIDYRIDGSHAVISGDYADRFGEKRYICDTVMSHHADIIVESPLAFVLQTADTLSGARPGARVNLEEGYQVRLTAIHDVVKSFPGIQDLAVMNGGREVHIQVHSESVAESEVQNLSQAVARKIEQEVTYPGQIKILVTRTYESSAVA